jgi:MFS transporter, ACS family, D-galactonate transporter
MGSGNPATRGLEHSLTSDPAISNRRRWGIVGLLFVASLINYLDRATISVALPLISVSLNLAAASKGLLLSAFFTSYALMQVPVGWCVDRFNLRWIYSALFALWSFACGLTGLAGSLGALIAFRVLLGIGESIYLPGGTKIVSVLFEPRERGLPCGIFDSGTRAGLVFGAPAVAWLIVLFGWRKMFSFVGFSALVWLIPWWMVFPARLSGRGQGPATTRPAESFWDVLKHLRSRDLIGICLGFFCFDYYWYLLVTWLPDYLVTVRHLTILKAGLYASLPYFVWGISEPIGGWIADRLISSGWDETRSRKWLITVAFISGLLLIPAARAQNAHSAIILIMGASLVGLATGNLFGVLQSCAPPEEVGVWTGFENFAGNVGGVIAPAATGLLIARTGSYLPGFALAALVLLTGLLAYWFIVGDLKPQDV